MSENEDRSLLEILGGEAGCRRLAQDFYGRVAVNAVLKPLFPGKSLRCATEEFAAFLIQFLDGDPDQTQYRWWLSLHESHARFQISERQRLAWLGLMNEAIDSVVSDVATRHALKQFFRMASAYVVRLKAEELVHGELQERWGQQKTLDQLIDHLKNDRDEDAIDLARQFTSRPSVLVGILARMMDAGRAPLVEFVLTSIQSDKNLASHRFNGRTLLHFAAGSGRLLVVRQLTADGMNPDVLDGGGHTPLYRTAGSTSEQGAAIVGELVRAGATVDHCGGVNNSTALHEAARHGNLAVAEALLNCGANPAARDKKGFTPLDRAINCRRTKMAGLLMAAK